MIVLTLYSLNVGQIKRTGLFFSPDGRAMINGAGRSTQIRAVRVGLRDMAH